LRTAYKKPIPFMVLGICSFFSLKLLEPFVHHTNKSTIAQVVVGKAVIYASTRFLKTLKKVVFKASFEFGGVVSTAVYGFFKGLFGKSGRS
jgi:hypothetical protein